MTSSHFHCSFIELLARLRSAAEHDHDTKFADALNQCLLSMSGGDIRCPMGELRLEDTIHAGHLPVPPGLPPSDPHPSTFSRLSPKVRQAFERLRVLLQQDARRRHDPLYADALRTCQQMTPGDDPVSVIDCPVRRLVHELDSPTTEAPTDESSTDYSSSSGTSIPSMTQPSSRPILHVFGQRTPFDDVALVANPAGVEALATLLRGKKVLAYTTTGEPFTLTLSVLRDPADLVNLAVPFSDDEFRERRATAHFPPYQSRLPEPDLPKPQDNSLLKTDTCVSPSSPANPS